MDRREGKTVAALRREFNYPTLYQQLHIKLPVTEPGERKPVTIFRCRPWYEGGPWYDYVRVYVMEEDEDDDGRNKKAFYAAQLLAFVDITKKAVDSEADDECEVSMLALVKYFLSALAPGESEDVTYTGKDLTHVSKHMLFPLVHPDPNPVARYGLIDTEQIENGVWVQEDFQTPGRFWVITSHRE